MGGPPTLTVGSADQQPATNVSQTNLSTTPSSSAAVGAAAVASSASSPTSQSASIPKSVSAISMVPNGEVPDFNNNKNSGEAYA